MSTSPTNKTRQIMDRLETMRAESPVLWAVTRGATTMLKIGIMTGLTPKQVDEELTDLKNRGIVKFYMNKAWTLAKSGKDYEANAEAARLAGLIEARWIDQSNPETLSEIIGMISPAGRTAIKAGGKAQSAADREAERMTLTVRQSEVWEQISSWLENQGRKGGLFTTREAALAQGYSKAGFTKGQLLALVRKGKARYIEGRPEKWALIE